MAETIGNHRGPFNMKSTAAALSTPPLSRIPWGRLRTAKPIARILVVVMAVASMAFAGPGLAQAQTTSSTDRAALVALYNATDGPNWTNNDNWLSDRPLGEWHGVTTDADGRVTGLRLGGNRLSGQLPEELGSLANLRVIYFGDDYTCNDAGCRPESPSANQLSGGIPPELGSLASLESLNLSANQLSGGIPPELGSLASLERLYLGANQLSGELPAWLGGLGNLKSLSLNGNQLSGRIPPELGELSELNRLYIFQNRLTGPIPRELGRLTSLERLLLSKNQLSGEIPSELGSLLDLKQLWLRDNRLTGPIPPELGRLTSLEDLNLRGNQLTGCIPAAWRDVPKNDLDALGLPFCAATTTPEPDGDPASDREALVALYQATDGDNWSSNDNWLSDGPIGEWHGVTTDGSGRVTALDLGDNQLNGEIPDELGNLSSLTYLDLFRNQLTGEIPSELGSLSNLEGLHISENQLTGPIPPGLGGLSNLEGLFLDGNQLTGAIPSELGDLSNLVDLFLAGNQLTGTIPPELGRLSTLKSLYLNDNSSLSGPLPGSFTGLTLLSLLSLSGTGLCAPTDAAFQAWLGGIGDRVGVVNCGAEEPVPVPAGPCLVSLGALTAPVTRLGAWASDCPSTARSGSYARYYSFSLNEAKQVEINLTSSADPYLALRQGAGRDGVVEVENDNVGSRNFNSSINQVLAAGAYTVEATTYFAGQTGDFTLSVRPLQETEDLGDLTRSVDRSNSRWTSDHESTQQMGSYARSYAFTLDAATHVVINLTSPEDPYLFLLDTNGAVVYENDNVTTRNLNSRIDETLPAGTYTIEATTYFPARAGTFHLSIGYFGVSQ